MISSLYDNIIYTSINRIAADMIVNNNDDNNNNDNNKECSDLNTLSVVLIFVIITLLSFLVSLLIYLYIYTDVLRNWKYKAVGNNNNNDSNSNREPLITDDIVDSND